MDLRETNFSTILFLSIKLGSEVIGAIVVHKERMITLGIILTKYSQFIG